MSKNTPRRWLAEASVIVLSILLAFGIDASWDGIRQRTDTRQALLNLMADFDANAAEAEAVIRVHELRRERFARFQAMDEAEVRAVPSDSLGPLYIAFLDPRSFDAVSGTLDALISTGGLGLIGDEELRVDLARFLNLLEDSGEERAWMQEVSVELWREFSFMGGPWRDDDPTSEPDELLPQMTVEDLVSIHQSPRLMGLIRLDLEFAAAYVREVQQLHGLATSIVERIRTQIG